MEVKPMRTLPKKRQAKEDPEAYLNLLPPKKQWSEEEQEQANASWKAICERVSHASEPLKNGEVSEETVKFDGRIVARREMSKHLIFLELKPLRRCMQPEGASKMEEDTPQLQVMLDVSRWRGSVPFEVEATLLRPEAEAWFQGLCGKSLRHGDALVYCFDACMLSAKPHPVYIQSMIELMRNESVGVKRVAESLEMSEDAVAQLSKLSDKTLRQQAARISRLLQGRNAQASRLRPCKIDKELLDALEQASKTQAKFHMKRIETTGDFDVVITIPSQSEESEQKRRDAYAHGKKAPQVRWMLQRLNELFGGRAKSSWFAGEVPAHQDGNIAWEDGNGWTVVDVGGGRGDLTVNIAKYMSKLKVEMLEVNLPSLEAARTVATEVKDAEGREIAERIRFREENVTELLARRGIVEGGGEKERLVLVGLHACGGLTDAILSLARREKAPFLCCPCCFLKHFHLRELAHNAGQSEQESNMLREEERGESRPGEEAAGSKGDTSCDEWEERWRKLAKLGELTDPHEESVRCQKEAMIALGSARLGKFDKDKWELGILSFADDISARNLVLVGLPCST